jgi:hypothetical protein
METPSFKEDHISQIPALQMLVNLGYVFESGRSRQAKRWKNFQCVAGRCIAEAVKGNQQHQSKCYQNKHFHRREY